MFESFFGFQRRPFGKTPDPSFLYESPQHAEALARLEYAVEEKDLGLLVASPLQAYVIFLKDGTRLTAREQPTVQAPEDEQADESPAPVAFPAPRRAPDDEASLASPWALPRQQDVGGGKGRQFRLAALRGDQ